MPTKIHAIMRRIFGRPTQLPPPPPPRHVTEPRCQPPSCTRFICEACEHLRRCPFSITILSVLLLVSHTHGQSPTPASTPAATVSLRLAWDHDLAGVENFVLSVRHAGSASTEEIVVPAPALSVPVHDLRVGTTYHCVVIALSAQGVPTGPSNELILPIPAKFDAPTNLRIARARVTPTPKNRK